jgi:hypothetical protein
LTIELVVTKQALPLVGRITIKERISKHHSGLGGAHRSDDPDRIARPAVSDFKLETCPIVRRRHSEDRGRDRDLPLLLGIAAQ